MSQELIDGYYTDAYQCKTPITIEDGITSVNFFASRTLNFAITCTILPPSGLASHWKVGGRTKIRHFQKAYSQHCGYCALLLLIENNEGVKESALKLLCPHMSNDLFAYCLEYLLAYNYVERYSGPDSPCLRFLARDDNCPHTPKVQIPVHFISSYTALELAAANNYPLAIFTESAVGIVLADPVDAELTLLEMKLGRGCRFVAGLFRSLYRNGIRVCPTGPFDPIPQGIDVRPCYIPVASVLRPLGDRPLPLTHTRMLLPSPSRRRWGYVALVAVMGVVLALYLRDEVDE